MSSVVRGALGVLGVAGTLGLGGVVASQVAPVMQDSPTAMTQQQRDRVEQAASASLFGQFRSSMADFLYLKVDKYLHRGVDLRGLTPMEAKKKDADGVTTKDEGFKHKGDETTVVPSSARDWRGVFGDIEREIKPYQNMEGHEHEDPKEALPLFRLMTWSNPQFVPGYVNGATLLARDKVRIQEAVDFLHEGERNNPSSIEIKAALGQMLTAKQHRLNDGFLPLRDALQLGEKRDMNAMTSDEKDAYRDAFRWMVLNRRDAGDIALARKTAQLGLRVFPDDVVCRHFLANEGK
jgi:hypothetical protein